MSSQIITKRLGEGRLLIDQVKTMIGLEEFISICINIQYNIRLL